MTDAIRLRECPFCMGNAKILRFNRYGKSFFMIGCVNASCIISVGGGPVFENGNEEMAAALWNYRQKRRYSNECE